VSLEKSNEQIWLVKSSGVVRGPFHFIELIDEIKKRNVAILDEVRTPKSRWKFIREQRELIDIVNAIREEDAIAPQGTGITHTASMAEATKSISVTKDLLEKTPPTGTDHSNFIDEQTPVPEFDRRGKKLPAFPLPSTQNTKENIPRPAGISGPVPFRPETISKSKLLYYLPVIFLLLLGLYFFDLSKSNRLAMSSEELVRLAQQYRSQGLYLKAQNIYERAENTSGLSVQAKKEYLSTLLLTDENLQDAERILKDLQSPKVSSQVPENYLANWKGMVFSYKKLYLEANQEFEKSVGIDKQYRPALINRIVNGFFIGQHEKMWQNYLSEKQANGDFNKSKLIAVGLAMLESEPLLTSQNIQIMIEDLQKGLSRKAEGVSEIYFLLASFFARAQKMNESQLMIERLVSVIPMENNFFIPELDTLSSIFNWALYVNPCVKLAQMHSGSIHGLLLSAYCAVSNNDLTNALALIEEIQRKYPESNLHIGMQVYILKKLKRIPEAKILASSSQIFSSKLTLAEICFQEKDLSCLEISAQHLSANAETQLYGLYWSARLALLRNNKEIAKQEIAKGLALSERYLPLLELKEELDAH